MDSNRARRAAGLLCACAAAVVVALGSRSAFAGNVWMACTGNVTSVTDGATKTEPSQRIVAYDDATQQLYQYSDKRKVLDPVAVSSYAPGKITWGNDQLNASGAAWQGTLARPGMILEITWRDRNGATMNWKEQCRPTNPL